ncbi:hypothetical protein BH11PSE11_BH11PSE11_17290 [soil metagenome]
MSAPIFKLPKLSPAIQALLIQFISLPISFLAIYAVLHFAGLHASLITASLLQGVIASLISRVRKLAPWWWLIQFLFPIALVTMLAFDLPPLIFLGAFLVLLSLYWTTFRTQVPFYPSGTPTWNAVAELLPGDRPIQLIDIGSGLGGLIIHLAGRRPDCVFTGIEVAPLPWLASVLRARMSRLPRDRARFIRGDYYGLDFSQYDVVFAYLSPAAMPALWQKALREMRPGSLLLSYEFPIPDVKSHIIMMPVAGGPGLFAWRM